MAYMLFVENVEMFITEKRARCRKYAYLINDWFPQTRPAESESRPISLRGLECEYFVKNASFWDFA